MRFHFSKLLAGLILVSLAQWGANLTAYAQENVGKIVGTVRDPSGAVIPKATVIAQNTLTGAETEIATNDQGAFVISALNVGTYVLKVSTQGFKTVARADVRVVSGQTLTVDVELPVGEMSQTETVTEALTTVDTTTSSI